MPEELRVFLASPGDVQHERNLLPEIVKALNKRATARTGKRLRLVRWEEDVLIGPGEETQQVIDRQITEAHITIVIFWKRLGQLTNKGQAPTVEEFHRAVRHWRRDRRRHVLVYFKTAFLDPRNDDLEQALKVEKFRREIASYTLYREFETTPEFRARARRDLEHATRDWAPRTANGPVSVKEALGDVERAFSLGLRAVEANDDEEAAKWLEAAAEADHAGGMLNLALLLKRRGDAGGGQDDLDVAFDWFLRSADKGDPVGMYNVGLMVKKRKGPEEAEPWLRKAAELGDVAAMYNLGMVLLERKNTDEGERWLRAGAEGGDVAAMYNLGKLLRDRGEQDGAGLWLRRGAEGGDPWAMKDLADFLDRTGEREEANVWRERGAVATAA
jgi:TPR repeat protein